MSENKNRVEELKKKTSLYAIVSVCLLIAGCAAYLSAKRNTPKINVQPEFSAEANTVTTTSPISANRVNEAISGVEDDRTSEAATEAISEITELSENLIVRAESFSLPVDSKVTKQYSDSKIVYSKTTDDWRSHNGIDFAGTMGDPVIAVNNGTVTDVYYDSIWGTVVEIDHGEGLIARYCGLGKGSTVDVGEKVKINQRIGNLSEIPIENGDGIHLHFETTLDGVTVNPIVALGLNENDFN